MTTLHNDIDLQRSDDEGLEMDPLQPNTDKRTRFQVNRVRNESHNAERDGKNPVVDVSTDEEQSDDDDYVHSITDRTRLNSESDAKYAKSFR